MLSREDRFKELERRLLAGEVLSYNNNDFFELVYENTATQAARRRAFRRDMEAIKEKHPQLVDDERVDRVLHYRLRVLPEVIEEALNLSDTDDLEWLMEDIRAMKPTLFSKLEKSTKKS